MASTTGGVVETIWTLLEVSIVVEPLTTVLQRLGLPEVSSAITSSAITLSRPSGSYLTLVPLDQPAEVWENAIHRALNFLWQADTGIAHKYGGRMKILGNLLQKTTNRIVKLEEDLSRVTEANIKMQNTNAATERAAAEIVDQKMVEVRSLKQQLFNALEEKEAVQEKLKSLGQILAKKDIQLSKLLKEWNASREALRKIRDDMEESERDADKVLLRLMKKRDEAQRLEIENRRLRKESETGATNFQEAYTRYRGQITMLEEMLGATDIFDLLRQKLLLAETKISLLEGGESKESDEIRKSLPSLERDIRFREAAARAQYIHFKSKLLSNELEIYSGSSRNVAATKLMNQVLERLSWVLP